MQTRRFSAGDLDRFNSPLPDLPTLRHSGNHNNLEQFRVRSFEFEVSSFKFIKSLAFDRTINQEPGTLNSELLVVVVHATRYYV